MNYKKKVPEWKNVGTEPPEELKTEGFKAGYKPPAAYFNWFFNRIGESVKEIHGLLKGLAFKDKVGNEDITDVAGSKVTQDSTHRLLTDTERTNWNDANAKKHTHGNKTVIDKITQTLLDNWSAAYTHISDAVKHITSIERTNWNDANAKKHTHGNKGILDGITQGLLDNWNAASTHVGNKDNPHAVTKSQVGLGSVPNVTTNNQAPTYTQADKLENIVSGEKLSVSLGKIMKALADFIAHKADTVIHLTAAERTKWNAVTNKVDKISGKQLSTNDYTTAEKNKLSEIAAGAEVNVQPDWNVTDTASDAYIKNRPGTFPPSSHTHDDRYYTETEMNTKLDGKSDTSHSHAYSAITGKPSTFAPSAHAHDDRYYTETETNTKLATKVDTSGGDIANTKVASFTASTASYPVPAANDTVKVGFGKIKKFFEDIRNATTGACFIGSIVNNCVTNNAKLPLSAAQGKVLMDLYTKLNSDLASLLNRTAKFCSYYVNSESEYIINALGDTWAGIPDSSCFFLFLVWKGQVAHIIGFKATDYYGQLTVDSYAEGLRLKYYITEGNWIQVIK